MTLKNVLPAPPVVIQTVAPPVVDATSGSHGNDARPQLNEPAAPTTCTVDNNNNNNTGGADNNANNNDSTGQLLLPADSLTDATPPGADLAAPTATSSARRQQRRGKRSHSAADRDATTVSAQRPAAAATSTAASRASAWEHRCLERTNRDPLTGAPGRQRSRQVEPTPQGPGQRRGPLRVQRRDRQEEQEEKDYKKPPGFAPGIPEGDEKYIHHVVTTHHHPQIDGEEGRGNNRDRDIQNNLTATRPQNASVFSSSVIVFSNSCVDLNTSNDLSCEERHAAVSDGRVGSCHTNGRGCHIGDGDAL